MMKFFDIDWTEIFAFVPTWDAMCPSSRKVFLNPALNHLQSLPGTDYGQDLNPMVAAGLIREGAPGRFKPSEPSGRLFRRVLMQMAKFPLFDRPSERKQMDEYVDKHFVREDADRMRCGFRDSQVPVNSEAWLRAFLDCADPYQWEETYKGYNREKSRRESRSMWGGFGRAECVPKLTHLTSDAVTGAARSLVKLALDSPVPLPLRALCGGIPPGVDARTIADAFKAAVRYLLLFPALRADSYEAVFWIRPSIGNRLHRAPAAKPQPVPVEEFSVPPFFLEDASLVAARALAEPLRIKKHPWITDLFEKVRQELLEALGDLPEPVGSRFPGEDRLTLAMELLFSLKFVSNNSTRVSVTKAGSDWLRQPTSDRLQILIDAFRKHRKPVGKAYVGWRSGPLGFSPMLLLQGKRYSATLVDGSAWIEAVWTQAKMGRFFLLEDWLDYHSRASLPPGVGPDTTLLDSATDRQTTAADGGEEIFRNFHAEFFFARLIPLGGVRLGRSPDGHLGFSLNETGNYLLRGEGALSALADEAAGVVVQPNFEIVFMQPSALAEAELAGFAERCGHRVGSLFRLTKSSTLKAARLGNTAAGVLETLSRISSKPLPENVRHQIRDWFKVCRDVEVRRSLILTVPDEETTRRLTLEFGEKCRAIAPRTLELRTAAMDPKSVKKLESLGIFLRNRDG